jgi:hypothetical protein
VTSDDGAIAVVAVSGAAAAVLVPHAGVADWEARVPPPLPDVLSAGARDRAGNEERTPHKIDWRSFLGASRAAAPRSF